MEMDTMAPKKLRTGFAQNFTGSRVDAIPTAIYNCDNRVSLVALEAGVGNDAID
jgi:hypothetical protein